MVVVVPPLDHQWTAEEILHLYRARWQIELVFKRINQLLRAQIIRSTTAVQAEATVRLLLVAWVLHEQEAACVRIHLRSLHQQVCQAVPSARALGTALGGPAVSSWVLASVCLATLRSQVLGQWCWVRLHTCLPRLLRFLCPSPRHRTHQETVIRTWLLQHGFTDIRPMEGRTR